MKNLGRHLAAYMDLEPKFIKDETGRERIFAKKIKENAGKNEANGINQWRYRKKDKLFELQYDDRFRETNRISEPQKYLESTQPMHEVSF